MQGKLKTGDIIKIHAHTRLKGLKENRRYMIASQDEISYNISNLKGSKIICRHYKMNIDIFIGNEFEENNIIEIVGTYKNTNNEKTN